MDRQATIDETRERLIPPEILTLKSGYSKSHEVGKFRRFTMRDIRGLDARSVYFLDNSGQFRVCRVASKLKTWKRDPNRFECSFKYGLYECFRLDTQQMIATLLVRVDV